MKYFMYIVVGRNDSQQEKVINNALGLNALVNMLLLQGTPFIPQIVCLQALTAAFRVTARSC